MKSWDRMVWSSIWQGCWLVEESEETEREWRSSPAFMAGAYLLHVVLSPVLLIMYSPRAAGQLLAPDWMLITAGGW